VTFLQEALAHPVAFVSGCAIWLPLTVWLVCMVQWWVAGEVEAVFAVTAIGLGLGVGVMAIKPPVPWLSPVLLLIAVLTVALFVPLRKAVQEHQLTGIDAESLSRYIESLARQPDNLAARIHAGDLLFRAGHKGHAVALCRDAVAGLNPAVFRAEIQALRFWEANTRPDEIRAAPCLRCGVANEPGTLACVNCSAPVILDLVRGTTFQGDLAKRLVSIWIVGALVLGGIPVLFAYLSGTPALLIVGILLLAAVAVWIARIGGVFSE
jgi:hypothetical protein